MDVIIKTIGAVINNLNAVRVSGKEDLNRQLASIMALESVLPKLKEIGDVTVTDVTVEKDGEENG